MGITKTGGDNVSSPKRSRESTPKQVKAGRAREKKAVRLKEEPSVVSVEEDMTEIDLPSGRFRRLGRGLHAGAVLDLPLRAVRAARGVTQAELAKATGMARGDISELEAREVLDDAKVAMLRRFVEGLGGELDLVVRFGERRYRIVPH